MSINVVNTSLPGVLLIETTAYTDERGFFMETYSQRKYKQAGIDACFVQDNCSQSQRGTLRGLHYQLQHPQGKLIYVTNGEIFDIVVDIRFGSPTFGKWYGSHLSSQNHHQLYIPQGFAHGFYVLSDIAEVTYKCTDFYTPGDEYGIFWADPDIDVKWLMERPILSEKDAILPELRKVPKEHLPIYPCG
ncbi:dTDP-4-dehydrorhamnose 3,5-epimerase [Desulfobacterales bacterium HSG17]|nr:dTDP-4-dehydrorhamnose 3,5-epimerase [Desulfobacterales bacterium HSG17]